MKIAQAPQFIGHRGHGSEPENTMRAFRKGHEVGADRIEFDIQKDADGDYIVIHDPTVDRTTNGSGRVADLSTAELLKFDAGKGEKLPLFKDVVAWAVQNDVCLDIELKHPHPGDEHELARTIRESGLRDPWVMSFDGDFMQRFEEVCPEVTTGVLVHERPLFDRALHGAGLGLGAGLGAALVRGMAPLGFAASCVGGLLVGALAGYKAEQANLRRKDLDLDVDVHIPGKRTLNRKLVRKAHEQGKQVAVYTIDKPKKAEKLANWGVDALISNFPDRLRDHLSH